ncbi:MAG TPA: hypothetical protein VIM12_01865 [Noviherbaspirillum sp.]|jgi:hypothetical protein|uniref:hypothetical protein n=1 Tax=Noviherbaspirillum sp. TaxID=1926288 RepID=UPI002F9295ED
MFDKPVMSDPARQPTQADKKNGSNSMPAVRRLAQWQRAERERMDRFGRFGGR